MSDPQQVVVRLLAAIDERERIAQRAAGHEGFWALASEWPGSATSDHVLANTPKAVARRCRADRKIVDEYQSAVSRGYEYSGDMEAEGYLAGLRFAIEAIADGYTKNHLAAEGGDSR